MLVSAKMGIVKATTRPPIWRARLDGSIWGSLVLADDPAQGEKLMLGCLATGDWVAFVVGVRRRTGGREAEAAGLKRLLQDRDHGGQLFSGGFPIERFLGHDIAPQSAVSDQEPGVDPDPAFETVEKLAEGLPIPIDPALESQQGHALDLSHHAAGVVGIGGPA